MYKIKKVSSGPAQVRISVFLKILLHLPMGFNDTSVTSVPMCSLIAPAPFPQDPCAETVI